MLLNETGVFDEADGETLVIFQNILIDDAGNYNVSSVVENGIGFSNLPDTIQDAVIKALNSSQAGVVNNISEESVETEQDDTDNDVDKVRFEFEEDKSDLDSGDLDYKTISENQKPDGITDISASQHNLSEMTTNIENIQIVILAESFFKIAKFEGEIIPRILDAVTATGIISPPVVYFINSEDTVDQLENSVLINYLNCSVTFNNQELKVFENQQIEQILAVFEQVDRVLKNSTQNLSVDIALCQNETEEDEKERDEDSSPNKTNIKSQSGPAGMLEDTALLLISLQANRKDDVSNLELLEEAIASNIHKNVLVEVREKSEILENSSEETVTVDVDLTKLSKPQVLFTDKRIDAILSSDDQTNLKQEIENFVGNNNFSLEKSEKGRQNGSVLIAISCRKNCLTVRRKFDFVQNSLEELTDTETIIIFQEEESTLEEQIKDSVRYLFNISLNEEDTSYGNIVTTQTSNKPAEGTSDSERRMIEAVKKVIDDVYDTNLEFAADPVVAKTSTEATRPEQDEKSYERIIDILGDLFVKTVDLSFKIKGAMDRNSDNDEGVEFDIISRNEDVSDYNYPDDSADSEMFKVPDLIKITPDDAMFVHASTERAETIGDDTEDKKTIIIDLENEENISFNVSNGMVFEIDLSYLPTDPEDREEEIRLRVKTFINGLKLISDVEGEEDTASGDRTELSDAIIKNITQIVLLQMDDALANKEVTSQRIFDIISPTTPTSPPPASPEVTTVTSAVDLEVPPLPPIEEDDERLTTEIITDTFINQAKPSSSPGITEIDFFIENLQDRNYWLLSISKIIPSF